ncbi:transcription factor bHLH112-like [Canna indica]|uniref:Transcription factor bHLH112-like n=1 Tax=Canna indica TaxID=4628 RepID=A0AAQ3L6E5_9LILI|nr:transcription factor bHLH112-like [Canna indica]
MADQFQAGSYTSGNWWSTAARHPTAGFVDGVSCSTELAAYNWAPGAAASEMFEAKSRSSCDESPVSISNSSVTFQDHNQNSHVSAGPLITGLMLDAAPQAVEFGLASPSVEWSHAFFGRSENNVHGFLQEDLIARTYGAQRDSGIESNQIYNRGFLQDHIDSFPLLPSSGAGLPYTALNGLLEHDGRLHNLYDDAQATNNYKPSIESPPEFIKASAELKQPPLQFSNETPFWNPTAASSTATQAHSNLHHERRPPQPVFKNQSSSYSCNNLIAVKNNTSEVGGSSAMEKRNGSEPAIKKPRMETPSPLPTFKVRKEKLGDRITALQQLVSPFGKTDTASVLHEATEYIKFLHDQVRVLSAPYLKNGNQMQQVKSLNTSKDSEGVIQHQDLRSRGLCLVPVSSTFAVANEMHTDFWTPSFMGTFR